MERAGKSDEGPAVMPWLFSKSFRKENPQKVYEIKERFASGYLSRNSAAFERQMKANVTHDTRGVLDRIEAPTLILVGKDDELTPPGMADALRKQIPKARVLLFPQGGHGLYWEVPHLFNKAVIDFLKDKDVESSGGLGQLSGLIQ